MVKGYLPKTFKGLKNSVIKHSPEVLTGIGIAGMITTTVLAVKATPKALDILAAAKEEKGEELTKKDVIKSTWKCYVPAAVTCIVSATCLIGASSVNSKRNTALATAYKLSETALTEYKEKVIETIGEKKEKDIREQITDDHIKSNPVTNNEVYITDKGNTLCYDTISGRYFKGDIDKIKRSVNELNREMLNDNCISLNEFYDEVGLEHTSIGDELGWNVSDGFIELYLGSHLAEDDTPCVSINFETAPRYGYSRVF